MGLKAQERAAFPSFDRYDQEDRDEEDHDAEGEDDEAHQGHLEEDHGCQEGGGQEGEEGGRKGKSLAMKKKGVGIFAPKVLSPALATICGGKKMARTEVTKKIWS